MLSMAPPIGAGTTFGERLRALRLAAGLTQEALAERAGLSLNAINSLERGQRRSPYPRTIRVLADALDLSEEDFAGLAATARRRPALPAAASSLPPLPVPLTTILGRDDDIEAAVAILRAGTRLLTITGTGGVGKTRLALQIATAAAGDYPDGAVMIPLAAVTDPALVASAIVQELGAARASGAPSEETLTQFLEDREALLVLDNFEQVVGAAPMVSDLLRSCPGLTLIVTSRVALHIEGEHEFPLAPLAVPDHPDTLSPDMLADNPAVALFVQRATSARPDFAMTTANAAATARLCERLDGLPLAIELAAARTRLLTPEWILEHVNESLTLLTGGGPDRPPRHQTIRAAIASSHDLLDIPERVLFRRLSVFAKGATLEEIAAVVAEVEAGRVPGSASAPALIATFDSATILLDHSLVIRRSEPDGDVRIDLLEVIRAFAREQLVASGEYDDVHWAHARTFLTFAERARDEIEGPRRRAAHDRIQREFDNLRGALRWLIGHDATALAQRLTNAMARFWIDLGYINEGRRWAERVLAMPEDGPPATRVEALYWAAGFANLQGDPDRCATLAVRARELGETHGDAWGVAMALTRESDAHLNHDLDAARTLMERALTGFRDTGDAVEEGIALTKLGRIASARGDEAGSTALHEQALQHWRLLDHPWGIPATLGWLADNAFARGDLETARGQYEESLRRWRALGERIHMCHTLVGLARLALASGQPVRAVTLLAAVDTLERSMGYVSPRGPQEGTLDAAQAVLGDDAFLATWAAGQSIPIDALLDDLGGATPES
jgi:predicted ATPase/DNA-binding XRE family transcriptional regulator